MSFRAAFAAFCLLLSTPHVSIAANDFGHAPIGAAIPYFGPLEKLPPSWSLCNGEVVRDQDLPLIGQRLLDLRDAFVRGASSKECIGKAGGSDKSQPHLPEHPLMAGQPQIPPTAKCVRAASQVCTAIPGKQDPPEAVSHPTAASPADPERCLGAVVRISTRSIPT